MSAAEMHSLEKAAMDDPFLADALEGYSKLQKDPADDLALLKSQLKTRSNVAKVIPIKKNNAAWKVAAAVVLIAALGWVVVSTFSNNKQSLAQQKVSPNASSPSAVPPSNNNPASSTQDSASLSSGFARNDNKVVTPEGRRNVFKNHAEKKFIAHDSANFYLKTDDLATGDEKKSSTAPAAVPKTETDDRARQEVTASVAAKTPQEKEVRREVAPPAGYLNNSNSFSGKVIDVQNRSVANATVVMNNVRQSTLTDQNGFFQFQSKDTIADISISSAGYQNVNLKLNSNQSSLITLDKTEANLDEVVVSGNGGSRKKKQQGKDLKIYVMDAEPVIGWEKYNQYIDSNKRIPQNEPQLKGEVVLSFKVNQKGELSSLNVEQSLNQVYDNEAIRLVKEGPAWRVTKGKKTKVKLIVRF
jgi:hypothetical protein